MNRFILLFTGLVLPGISQSQEYLLMHQKWQHPVSSSDHPAFPVSHFSKDHPAGILWSFSAANHFLIKELSQAGIRISLCREKTRVTSGYSSGGWGIYREHLLEIHGSLQVGSETRLSAGTWLFYRNIRGIQTDRGAGIRLESFKQLSDKDLGIGSVSWGIIQKRHYPVFSLLYQRRINSRSSWSSRFTYPLAFDIAWHLDFKQKFFVDIQAGTRQYVLSSSMSLTPNTQLRLSFGYYLIPASCSEISLCHETF